MCPEYLIRLRRTAWVMEQRPRSARGRRGTAASGQRAVARRAVRRMLASLLSVVRARVVEAVVATS
jgi:hypothetical protein